jgi:hypothetical protein
MLKIKRSPTLTVIRRANIIFVASIALLNILMIVAPYSFLRLMNPQLTYLPDPKDFAFYEFAPFYVLAIISLMMILIGVLLLPINSILLFIGWNGMNLAERRGSAGLWLFSTIVIGFMLSPVGKLIAVWLLD